MPFPSRACIPASRLFIALLVFALLGIALLVGRSAFAAQTAAKRPPKPSPVVPVAAGSVRDGIYRHVSFGFSYRIPFGWVERTDRMREDSDDSAAAWVLLAVFEHPPEATASSVNSAVVIAAESVSSYPGLKTAASYFGPLREVVTAKGFTMIDEPYECTIGTKQLVRADFSKARGSFAMHQASLVMLEKGYVVSWTFLGESDDEVEKLLGGLSFAPPTKTSGTGSRGRGK
jgi:hypothetical protein